MPVDLQQWLIPPRAGRYSRPRRPSQVLPLVYGDLAGAGKGVWVCPPIDLDNHVYCLAGHGVLARSAGNVIAVYDGDGALIDPAEYTINESIDYGGLGQTAAVIVFTDDKSACEPITASAKGRAAGDRLIDNPVDIVVDLLTEWAGMNPEEIDSTWRTRTADYLLGHGVAAAGVIDRDVRLDQILSRILSLMASWWRSGDGSLIFKPQSGAGAVVESDVVVHLPPSRLSDEGVALEYDEDQICTRAAVDYAYDYVDGAYFGFDDGSSRADLAAESGYGRSYLKKFELPWVRDPAAVGRLQELTVATYARPPARLSAKLSNGNFRHLEQGDVVSVSLDWIFDGDLNPLRNQLFRLVTVSVGLDQGAATEIEALDLGLHLTTAYPADGTYLADGAVEAGRRRDRTLYA